MEYRFAAAEGATELKSEFAAVGFVTGAEPGATRVFPADEHR